MLEALQLQSDFFYLFLLGYCYAESKGARDRLWTQENLEANLIFFCFYF